MIRLPKLPSKKMRWILIIGAILALMDCALLILSSFAYRSSLRQALAAGFIPSIESLAPPELPDDQNASLIIDEIEKRWPDTNYQEKINEAYNSAKEADKANRRLTDSETAILREALQSFSEALPLLEKAFVLEDARFKADYKIANPFAFELPNYQIRQELAILLRFKGLLAIHEGLASEAYRIAANQLRFSRWCFEETPTLISALIGVAVLDIACDSLHRMQCLTPPSAVERESILEEAKKFRLQECFMRSVKMEFAAINQFFDSSIQGKLEWNALEGFLLRYPGRFFLRANQSAGLTLFPKYLDLASHYSCERKEIKEASAAIPSWAFILQPMLPIFNNAFKRKDIMAAKLELMKTSLALLERKEKNGAYPNDLESLENGAEKSSFLDPFSGHSLIYRPRNVGFLLYSIGPDFKDDGGVPPPSEVEWDQNDLVWEIP